MIIVVVFDLKTRQYDAINVFVNSEMNELIYCKLSDDWKKVNELSLLLIVFYKLKQSLAFWYKYLINTLNELKLKQMSNIKCFFINDYMIFFFFMNDIAIKLIASDRNLDLNRNFDSSLDESRSLLLIRKSNRNQKVISSNRIET